MFQCSRFRRVSKIDGDDKTKKKGQGFYSAGSHARLHMQPPIAVLALLWFYQQRSSSQQSVCSKGQNCPILGISPGIEASSLEKAKKKRYGIIQMKHEGEPWCMDVSEHPLCLLWDTAMRINSPTFSLSLLPSPGARRHSLSLLTKSLTGSRTRFLHIFRHCSNHYL